MYKDQIEKDEFGPAGLQVAIRGMNCENVSEKKKKKNGVHTENTETFPTTNIPLLQTMIVF